MFGIINIETKNFRIAPTIERDSSSLKAFIIKHIERGNHILTDGWNGYDFLDPHIQDIYGQDISKEEVILFMVENLPPI